MQNQTSFTQPSPNADGLYGVQTWSAGPIFPTVIKCVEHYEDTLWSAPDEPLADRLITRHWVLMLDGVEDTYATREDAEQAASFLLNNPTSREARRAEGAEV